MSRDVRYAVVINHEEQYSIHPADESPPAGWRPTGFVGTRQEALAHVDRVWTARRPSSLRNVEDLVRKGRG